MTRTSWRNSPFSKLVIVILLLATASCGAGGKKQEQVAAKPPVSAAPALHFTDKPKILRPVALLPTVKGTKGVAKGKTEITPLGITLHWWSYSSGGDIQGLYKVLRKDDNSVQFGVTQDGKIYQMMKSPTSFARHASGGNETTIGIEIEGEPTDFALPGKTGFNQKKFEAVVDLVLMLMKEYKTIKLDGPAKCWRVVGIHGHDEYNACRTNGTTKDDPGPAYTKAVKDAVKGERR